MKRLLLASVSLLIATSANAQISSTGSLSPVTFDTPFNADFILPSPTPFIIGDIGDGEISVEGDLELSADRFEIGVGGIGILNVSGTDSGVIANGRIDMGMGAGAEINISDGGELITNTINFAVNDASYLYVTGADSHLQVNTDLTYGITSFADAQITNGATANIGHLNILSTGTNTIRFLIDDASVMTSGTYVDADNADLTLTNNSTLTASTNLVLQNGVIRVTDGSTLTTTTNNFMATGGQLIVENNSNLSTVNVELAGAAHISDSLWTNSGNAFVFGNFNLVNSTASTNALHFSEGFYNTNANIITLDNSIWNVATNTIFDNDSSLGGVAIHLNNQSTLNTTDFITSAEGWFNRINIREGSQINADNVIINRTGGYITTPETLMTIDGANSALNANNTFTIDPNGVFKLTLANEGTLRVDGDIILNSGDIASGNHTHLIIGDDEGNAATDAGFIDTTGEIHLDENTRIIFNHTHNNYIFDHIIKDISASKNSSLRFLSGTTSMTDGYADYEGSIIALGNSVVHLDAIDPLHPNITLETSDNAALYLYGSAESISGLYNDGTLYLDPDSDMTLTLTNFAGTATGTIVMETTLEDDNSPGDRIIVTGDTTGENKLKITNRNGLGAQTIDGIKLIEVHGTSDAVMTLVPDYNDADGQAYVIGGAYSYALAKGSLDGTTDTKSWYLRSIYTPLTPIGPTPPDPQIIYSPIASVLEAYPQALQTLNQLDDLDKRLANYVLSGKEDKYGIWFYGGAQHSANDPRHTTTNTSYKTNLYEMRGGVDIPVYTADSGALVAGLGGRYIHGHTTTKHNDDLLGQGKIKSTGYGIIPSLTWYSDNGFYIDGTSHATWYKNDLESKKLNGQIAHDNHAFGYALSAEIGKSFPLTSQLDFSLQGQLIYSHIKYDGFIDELDTAHIKNGHADALTGRLGGALTHSTHTDTSDNRLYAKLNLFNDLKNSSKTTISELNGNDPTDFKSERERVWAGLSLGGTHSWAGGKYSIYGEIGATTAFKHASDNHSMGGSVGFAMKF